MRARIAAPVALITLAALPVLWLWWTAERGMKVDPQPPVPVTPSETTAPLEAPARAKVAAEMARRPQAGATRLIGYVTDARSGVGLRGVPLRLKFRGDTIDITSRTMGVITALVPTAALSGAVEVLSPWTLAGPALWSPAKKPGHQELHVKVVHPFAILTGTVKNLVGAPVPGIPLVALAGKARGLSNKDGQFALLLTGHRAEEPVAIRLGIEERIRESTYRLHEPDRTYPGNARGVTVTVTKKRRSHLAFTLVAAGRQLQAGEEVDYAICSARSRTAPEPDPRRLHQASVGEDGMVRIPRTHGESGLLQFFSKAPLPAGRSACVPYQVPQPASVVVIQPEWSRRIRVLDERGRQVSGARIEVLLSHGDGATIHWRQRAVHATHAVAMKPRMTVPMSIGQWRSDAAGEAEIQCGTGPLCKVRCRAKGYAESLEDLAPGPAPHVIQLHRGGSVQVRISDPEALDAIVRGYRGKAPRFVLVNEQGRGFPDKGLPPGDGAIRFRGVEDGTWKLWLRAEKEMGFLSLRSGLGCSLGTVTIRNGGEHWIEADLAKIAAASLHGTVETEGMDAGLSLEVLAFSRDRGHEGEGFAASKVDPQGRFRIASLAPGKLVLALRATGPGFQSRISGPTLRIAPGEDRMVTWSDRRVRVRIELDDELKESARGAKIVLQDEGAEGWFELRDARGATGLIAPGTYQVLVGPERRRTGPNVVVGSGTSRILLRVR